MISSKYDVIIIGAGIGGLVCGCYLVKNGFKVLLIEQHYQVGGYCTSFKRKGYTFDAGVHYFGAGREGGELAKVVKDFSLDEIIYFTRIDPCDKVLAPGVSFNIRSNGAETVEEIKRCFVDEKDNIDNFFKFLTNKNFYQLYAVCKKLTFKDLLDRYFIDSKLKAALSILLGNIGLPPSRVAAISVAALYREFILDPGYCVMGGVQVFANALARRFKEYGGELILSQRVSKIVTKNNEALGVLYGKDSVCHASCVVSNADAWQTFNILLDAKNNNITTQINKLDASFSAFAVYLGVNTDLKNVIMGEKCAIWYFTTSDIEKCYGDPMSNFDSDSPNYAIILFPSFHDNSMAPKNKTCVSIFSAASFKDKKFWDRNRDIFADKLIKKAEEVVPGLSKYIEVMETATPHTFHNYTSNLNGALYGWACTVDQIDERVFPQETEIKNLILAGHWCTNGVGQGGISEVIYSGKKASKIILKSSAVKRVQC